MLQPFQKLAFLGFVLDSVNMKVFLTAEKKEKIISASQQLLKKSIISIRLVAQVIRPLASSLPAVQYGSDPFIIGVLKLIKIQLYDKVMATLKLL